MNWCFVLPWRAHEDSVTLMDSLLPYVTNYLIRSTPTRRGPRLHFISPAGFAATRFKSSWATQHKRKQPLRVVFGAAGPRGFEPRSTVLETGILPLNYRPLFNFNSSFYTTFQSAFSISSERRSRESLLSHYRVSAEIKKIVYNFLTTEL